MWSRRADHRRAPSCGAELIARVRNVDGQRRAEIGVLISQQDSPRDSGGNSGLIRKEEATSTNARDPSRADELTSACEALDNDRSKYRFYQLVARHESIPATRSLSRRISLVDKHQVVCLEILKPLVPRDGAELRGGREIEPDAGIAVMHIDHGRSRLGRLASRRLRPMSQRPPTNQLGIVGRDD